MRELLNRYYVIIALSGGVVRVDRHCPLLHLTCAFISYPDKRIYDERPTVIHHVWLSP